MLFSAAVAMVPASTLYDLPVSNHGARVRFLLYKKKLEGAVAVKPPADLGGLRSEAYLALNPQGKMPLLVDAEDGIIFETDAICRHLLDKYGATGPSLVPTERAARAKSEVLCSLHDAYLGPIQGCLYKPDPPFGRFGTRTAAIAELCEQLAVVEALADADGPYLVGREFSLADATLFPTVCFAQHMAPKFEQGAERLEAALGPRLARWWGHMLNNDEEAARIAAEIREGLAPWDGRGRWDSIRGAGVRDVAPPTIFDRILAGEVPSTTVYEDDTALAFRDIAPAAPVHILIIPKRRAGLSGLAEATAEHAEVLGHLMIVAAKVARQEGLSDWRLVTNNGEGAGQTVPHLHLHLLGGRPLTWPPG